MKFTKHEILDLLKAWFVISLAFAVLYQPGSNLGYFTLWIICLLTVGIGFLLHELAHKYTAQIYGFYAEFKAFDFMLVLSLIGSLFGFILAAPGAVFIHGNISKRKNGIISLAGPLINMGLALMFLIMLDLGIYSQLSNIGFKINAYLALFNMLPIFVFDGAKVWAWNKSIFVVTFLAAMILVFMSFV